MLITKEQQESLVENYKREDRSTDEVCGFIDGIGKIMELIIKLDSDKPKTFEFEARPLMKYLSENHHPMTTSIIDSTTAQIYEGVECFNTDEYIVD